MTDTPDDSRELTITRLIDAPPTMVYRCWTQPELIVQWFTPKPWSTVSADMDVRPGGHSLIIMADPEGNQHPNPGQFLEVVPNERLVFTDAYIGNWVPSPKPFMTGTLTFADEGGKTRYTAVVRHWTVEDRKAHEAMGFHAGWGLATDQLEAVAKSI